MPAYHSWILLWLMSQCQAQTWMRMTQETHWRKLCLECFTMHLKVNDPLQLGVSNTNPANFSRVPVITSWNCQCVPRQHKVGVALITLREFERQSICIFWSSLFIQILSLNHMKKFTELKLGTPFLEHKNITWKEKNMRLQLQALSPSRVPH